MQQLLLMLIFAFQSIPQLLVFYALLTPRCKVYFICLASALTSAAGYCVEFIAPGNFSIKTVVTFLLYTAFVFIFFKGKLLTKLFGVIAVFAISIACEIICATVFLPVFKANVSAKNFYTTNRIIMSLAVTVLIAFMCFIFYVMFPKSNFENFSSQRLFIFVLTAGQACVLWGCILGIMSENFLGSVFIMMIASVLLTITNFQFIKLLSGMQKKRELEQRLCAMEALHEIHVKSSEELQKKEMQAAKLRHDIKNHIITMQSLAENDEAELLNNYIDDLLLQGQ